MTIKEKRELQELKRRLARVEKELELKRKTPLGKKVSGELMKRVDKLENSMKELKKLGRGIGRKGEESMKELKELGRGVGIKGLKKILGKLEKGS